jgi:hypothetical protein
MQFITTYDLASIDAATTGSASMVRKSMRRPQQTSAATGVLALAVGVLIAAAVAAAGVAVHGLPPLTTASPLLGIAIDVTLLSLFAAHHQLVQSGPGLGRWLHGASAATRQVAEFVVAGALLGIVYAAWQPLPYVVWSVDVAVWRALLWAGWGAGWVLAWRGARVLAPLGKVRAGAAPRVASHAVAQLIAGGVLVNFCAPQMTGGHLLFAITMTAYLGACCVRRIGSVAVTAVG